MSVHIVAVGGEERFQYKKEKRHGADERFVRLEFLDEIVDGRGLTWCEL